MLQRLDEEKAPDIGLRAWAASCLGDRGWELVIAGSGVLRPDLERLAADLGCASTVDFAGYVADAGALFPPGDVVVAALLSQLAGDRAEPRTIGVALRERQRERYGLDLRLDRLESFYRV